MKSIKVNFLMNIVLTMSSFIFPIITFPYISRILEPEGLGKVQMAASFVAYFLMVSQLGLPTYGIRACAAVRDDRTALSRTVHELALIQLVMTVVAYAAFGACLGMIPRLRQEKVLYLISSLVIFLNTIGMEWLFKALEEYTYITVRSLVFKVIAVAAMFLCVHSKADYGVYAAVSVLASSGSNVMNLIRVPRYISLKPVGDYNIRRHLKPVAVLFAYVCATTIYTNLDSVMLGFLTTDVDVGYYSVAVKIKTILVSVVTALGTVLLPRVSYYYEQGMLEDFWKMAVKALRMVVLMALPLTVYFMIFARNGIGFLSGPGYAASVLPMVTIMPTLVCIGLTSVTGVQILIPTKREQVVLYASVAGAVVDLILNAWLIPPLGATGAAIGTLAAEAVVLLIHLLVLRRELLPVLRELKLGVILGSSACAAGAAWFVRNLSLSDFGALALSGLLFFGVYALVLYVGRDPFLRDLEQRALALLRRNAK